MVITLPRKKLVKKKKKGYAYNRKGKPVKVSAHEQGYWTFELTKREKKLLNEGKAKQLFDEKSERSKKMDRMHTSKKVFEKPSEEWIKNMNKYDVKGIDTHMESFTSIDALRRRIEEHLKKTKAIQKSFWAAKAGSPEKDRYRQQFHDAEEEFYRLRDQIDHLEAKKKEEHVESLKKYRNPKQDKKKLKEMQQKFATSMDKTTKELWLNESIRETGEYNTLGIMDCSHITMLTTANQFKGSMLDLQTKDRKAIKDFDIESKPLILNRYGFTYSFNNDPCEYDSDRIKLAMDHFDKPKIYYEKNKPLIIQDKEFTYAIAPRVSDSDVETRADYNDIILTKKEYKTLMKNNKKDDLLKKFRELRDDDKPPKTKHELLYEILTNEKIPLDYTF